ncbi:unnamed protein product [Moneuplotes crassus]|uniref:Uncharacterized protein n=1 Tax=Euplotes crassus TaxID=5936 RepID=A0AAD1XUX2_EUPCR|nr:unnamed protein product [Moneuplotes crassus]
MSSLNLEEIHRKRLLKSIIAKLEAEAKSQRNSLKPSFEESLYFIPTSERRKMASLVQKDSELMEILNSHGIEENAKLYESLSDWKNM